MATDRFVPALLEAFEFPNSQHSREELHAVIRAIAVERRSKGATMGTICGELARVGNETLRPLRRDLAGQYAVLALIDEVSDVASEAAGWTTGSVSRERGKR